MASAAKVGRSVAAEEAPRATGDLAPHPSGTSAPGPSRFNLNPFAAPPDYGPLLEPRGSVIRTGLKGDNPGSPREVPISARGQLKVTL